MTSFALRVKRSIWHRTGADVAVEDVAAYVEELNANLDHPYTEESDAQDACDVAGSYVDEHPEVTE